MRYNRQRLAGPAKERVHNITILISTAAGHALADLGVALARAVRRTAQQQIICARRCIGSQATNHNLTGQPRAQHLKNYLTAEWLDLRKGGLPKDDFMHSEHAA